jgi:hypothetical protein
MPDNSTPTKSTADKLIDIVHNLISSGSSASSGSDSSDSNTKADPVSDVIKTLSRTSIIGGANRKARMDQAIKDSGG